MAVRSAGLLLHRRRGGQIQVLLVHPGGPFWARKDAGAWSIPKGVIDPEEDLLGAARREFAEELGSPAPLTDPTSLGDVRQQGGKVVTAWAVEGDLDVTSIVSNTVTVEWPRGSGRQITFPEVDRAQWFDLPTAREKLLDGQRPFLDTLAQVLDARSGADPD